jgi:hypothetical protein
MRSLLPIYTYNLLRLGILIPPSLYGWELMKLSKGIVSFQRDISATYMSCIEVGRFKVASKMELTNQCRLVPTCRKFF